MNEIYVKFLSDLNQDFILLKRYIDDVEIIKSHIKIFEAMEDLTNSLSDCLTSESASDIKTKLMNTKNLIMSLNGWEASNRLDEQEWMLKEYNVCKMKAAEIFIDFWIEEINLVE